MIGLSVPFELLVLALVGLAGFGLGWWLRRARSVMEIERPKTSGPTAIVPSLFEDSPGAEPLEPISRESVATLAAASQAIQELHLLPTCPTCGSRMEMRIFKEKKIWVCEDFPVCRGAQMAE